jgi:transcriptional regulator with XRE-family HTH domain
MINIANLLDKAKVIHKLPSDYKLALVMGVQQSSLRNYRTGKTLPDERVISKICELTGDDPALLLIEIEAERAKTDEARALWQNIARRLSLGAAAGIGAAILSGCLWVGEVTQNAANSTTQTGSLLSHLPVHLLYIVRTIHQRCARAVKAFRGIMNSQKQLISKGNHHVFSPTSTASAFHLA